MKLSKLQTTSIFFSLLFLGSCAKSSNNREIEIMPDMTRSYAIRPQEEDINNPGLSSMKLAPLGTIPRGREVYLYKDPVIAGQELINPLPTDKHVIETGKRYYDIYCLPCHGAYGAGDGNVIKLASLQQRMPKPPELYSAKLMAYPDGQLYHILTVGQGNMPSYSSRISPNTRWAIINYIRALQEASKIQ